MTIRLPPDMKIRLSPELRRQVEEAARANNRTMNSEIVSRLEASFRDAGSTKSPESYETRIAKNDDISVVQGRLTEIENRMREIEKALGITKA